MKNHRRGVEKSFWPPLLEAGSFTADGHIRRGPEKQFSETLKCLRSQSHIGYWVCTEDRQLAGVININEIVRGRFCSGYLGYYALAPHNGQGYMKRGLYAVLSEAFQPDK